MMISPATASLNHIDGYFSSPLTKNFGESSCTQPMNRNMIHTPQQGRSTPTSNVRPKLRKSPHAKRGLKVKNASWNVGDGKVPVNTLGLGSKKLASPDHDLRRLLRSKEFKKHRLSSKALRNLLWSDICKKTPPDMAHRGGMSEMQDGGVNKYSTEVMGQNTLPSRFETCQRRQFGLSTHIDDSIRLVGRPERIEIRNFPSDPPFANVSRGGNSSNPLGEPPSDMGPLFASRVASLGSKSPGAETLDPLCSL